MYEYCEPVSAPCDHCGRDDSYYRLGLWTDASAGADAMETALCLNCLLELHPALHTRLPMLEDYLFDGHAVYENVDNDGAIVTFENELGVLSVIFETDYKTTTWTDPGGGPNSAGAPRRSQTSTTVSLDSAGRVEIIAPREQRTNITTTHWKTYLNP